ncbi:membrane integrity-associated transporter subunit PqiC [Sedimentimonas flavescens]|uniref:PqiC family protein n=1 Tax=Sedimentimonas flavescens TaxID=2851012 RepID=UPI001C4A5BE3|nr:PqiC family protein [Sedimentimonas flavescens]MBW0158019.1 PqiC family protein [Sedimentimonas flavescens]
MIRPFLLSLICGLALTACSDPAATARYAIAPQPAAKTLPNRLGQAELREVSLPQYAAGQEISYQTEDGALRSTPDNIWADDPPRAVTLALARQISAVSGATVIAEPWPLSEGPQRRIEVRVEQFLARADGVVQLTGVYFVTPAGITNGRDVMRSFDVTVPVAEGGPAAIAQAQSAAVAELARRIAQLD